MNKNKMKGFKTNKNVSVIDLIIILEISNQFFPIFDVEKAIERAFR